MRKYILLLCTICMGLVSCVKENMTGVETDGRTTFKAVYADAVTKTVLDGVTPMWTPEDKICIYDGRNNEFSNTLTAPAKTAEFKGVLGGNEQRYLAAIPYNVDLMFDLDKKGVYGLVMPYEQNAVENSCDPAALVAATYTENFELKFNLGALISPLVLSQSFFFFFFTKKAVFDLQNKLATTHPKLCHPLNAKSPCHYYSKDISLNYGLQVEHADPRVHKIPTE